jgi:hypothetical protein
MANEGKVFSGFSEDDEILTDTIEGKDTGGKQDTSDSSSDSDGKDTSDSPSDSEGKDTSDSSSGSEGKDTSDSSDNSDGKDTPDDLDLSETDFDLTIDEEPAADVGSDSKTSFDFIKAAKDLNIDLEEGQTDLDYETFVSKINDKIESSKEKFSYQGIPEDTVDVVKFFAENGGTVADLLNDHDVVVASTLLEMTDREKVLLSKRRSFVNAGLSEEDANERAEEVFDSMTEDEVARAVKTIDIELSSFKRQAITKVANERKAVVEKERQKNEAKAVSQRKEMVSVLKSMDQFMGMKIKPEVKEKIISQIESGDFDKTISSSLAKAKVEAYMVMKFGKQVMELQEKILKTKTAESYNKGVQKFIDKNHNHRPETREKAPARGGEEQKWSGLKELD